MAKKTSELRQNRSEVRSGERSYDAGLGVDDCPHPIGNDRRVSWMAGWYDARMRDELGHIFKKYGIVWP